MINIMKSGLEILPKITSGKIIRTVKGILIRTFEKYLVSSGYLVILFFLSINTLSFDLMTSTYFDSFRIPIITYATIVSECQVHIRTMKNVLYILTRKYIFLFQ